MITTTQKCLKRVNYKLWNNTFWVVITRVETKDRQVGSKGRGISFCRISKRISRVITFIAKMIIIYLLVHKWKIYDEDYMMSDKENGDIDERLLKNNPTFA